MALYVRQLSDEERTTIQRLTHSQNAPVRLAARAWIIKLSAAGETVPAIARRLDVGAKTVRVWIRRLNADGVAALGDAPRPGRPRTYDEDARSRVIAKARSLPPKPENGALPPTCHWTLDQLSEEFAEDGLLIKRSQIRRILKAEHLKWQKPRTWLESDDPHFAEKGGHGARYLPPTWRVPSRYRAPHEYTRGRSLTSTPTRRRAAP